MTLKITEEMVLDIHKMYLRHLNAGGDRFPLELDKPSTRVGDPRPRCSALLGCATQSAFERIGMQPSHPNLNPNDAYNKLLLFEEGRRNAEVWQEAFAWWGETRGFIVKNEADSSSTSLAGRADTIIEELSTGIRYLVELKRTEYGWSTKYGYQWAGYSRNTGIDVGFVIAQARQSCEVFLCEYEREGHYWHYSSGGVYIETITENDLQREIERHEAATAIVKSGAIPGAGPSGFIEGDALKRKYYCVSQRKEDDMAPRVMRSGPDKGNVRLGRETPNCQYYGYCYGRWGYDYTVSYDATGNIVYTETE